VTTLRLEPFSPMGTSEQGERPGFLQALTTEHFTLQTARAVTINESNGRTALYLGSLSSTLIALALVAQRSGADDVFVVFALTALPAVLFLGLVTHVRVLQSLVEDIIYARAINRIRHYYTEIDPARAHYFLLTGRDDVRGALMNMCVRDSWTQLLFTMPTAVAVINSLLGGVTGALAVAVATQAPPLPAALAGAGLGVVTLGLQLAWQTHRFARMKATVEALFPSPAPRPVGRGRSEGDGGGSTMDELINAGDARRRVSAGG
jgi:hypothetical protein